MCALNRNADLLFNIYGGICMWSQTITEIKLSEVLTGKQSAWLDFRMSYFSYSLSSRFFQSSA